VRSTEAFCESEIQRDFAKGLLLGPSNSTEKPTKVASARFDAVVSEHSGVHLGHSGKAHSIGLKVAIGALATDLAPGPDGLIDARQGKFEAHNPLRLLDATAWALDPVK
tara:strand:- start:108366 stop:108692 length:327 start_codon:yes stop_codon:yes gene_type:complete